MRHSKNSILEIRLNKELDKKTAEHFLGFSFGSFNMGGCILQVLPCLEAAIHMKAAKRSKIISREVDNYYKSHQEIIMDKKEEFEQIWIRNENKFRHFVEKIVDKKWPQGKVTLYLSIFDSGNNFLDNRSFQVWAGKKEETFVSSVVFELLCFYFDTYSKKHLKKFSDDERWHLTEEFANTFTHVPFFEKTFGFKAQADVPGYGHMSSFKDISEFVNAIDAQDPKKEKKKKKKRTDLSKN